MIKLMTKEKFPIDKSVPNYGKTFTEILSFQSFNKHGLEFFKTYHSQISKI